MNLNEAELGVEYEIKDIITDDDDMRAFLLTLGCYQGSTITVVTRKKKNMTVAIKDGRYNIDSDLAEAISV